MLFKNRRVQDWLRGEEIHRALPVFRGVGWPRVNLTPGVTYSCGKEPASAAPWAKCLLRNELRRRPDCNPPKPRMSVTNNVAVILASGVKQRKLLRSAAPHALANSASLVE